MRHSDASGLMYSLGLGSRSDFCRKCGDVSTYCSSSFHHLLANLPAHRVRHDIEVKPRCLTLFE